MLAFSQELNEKLAAAVLEKKELETRGKTAEEQLALTDQQHKQTSANLEKRHNEQLTVLKQQLGDLKVQHERRKVEVETQHKAEIAELKNSNDQLCRLQQGTTIELGQLKSKNAALEMELNICRKSDVGKEQKEELVRLEAEKSHVAKQLKASQDQLRKLETEKSTVIKTSEELRESLESKVAGLQIKLEESDQKCSELVTREHDSMQREQALVVAALQEKLVEKNQNDRVTVATSNEVLPPSSVSQSCFLCL